MLAPGEYLIKPPPEPGVVPPEGAPAPSDDAADEPDDEPSMTFLMILLRALGVMHT